MKARVKLAEAVTFSADKHCSASCMLAGTAELTLEIKVAAGGR